MVAKDDKSALMALIEGQNAQGAEMPEDLDSERYVWNEDGRLTGLFLQDCYLRGTLSLNGLDALKKLNCSFNQLEELDTSGCPALKTLWCSANRLKGLDASGHPELKEL